jgi:iron(III) transport system substrate-binding protein
MKSKIALLLAAWLVATATMAQTPWGIADLSGYDGPNREQILIEGAKKEGTLTLYTSIAQKDLPPLITAFEKKYGVKVQVWRAGSDKVLHRTLTETSGKRFEVDAVHIGAPELEALHLEKVLQSVSSPAFNTLLPGAVPAHREWVATRLTPFVQAYNTNLIKKEDLPKTWQELTDPKWKGKLGIEFTDDEWFYSLVQQLGEERGLKLFREIVAINGVSVRKGHTLLTNLVASGEVPLALTVYNYMAEALKKRSAPINWFVLQPAITRANGIGIARQAPHPHAALLFYDHMLSVEAQKMLVSMDYIPTHASVESPMKSMNLKVTHPTMTSNEAEKWARLYQEIISATPEVNVKSKGK